MRLIALEAICPKYMPIVLWLQEVDEQVRSDSLSKAGGFLQAMQKFSTYFYIEVLRMVYSIVESASAWL